MKLRWFFLMIIGFVVLAFAWLTYSLVYFSNNEYKLKNQILKTGREICILKVLEKGKDRAFSSYKAQKVILKDLPIDADTAKIHEFLQTDFDGNYTANFTTIGKAVFGDIQVSDAKKMELKEALDQQVNLYLLEVFLLTLLVGGGIFGVYYSVNSMYDLNKQQNNFLLSVTHEFKTPIAAMKLMLQTIRYRKLPDEKRNELLDKAIDNSNRLNELAENMLTAMQIENESYTYGEDDVDISAMMEEIVEHFQFKGTITSRIQPGIRLKADAFILRICVNNLVENALKYSEFKPVELVLTKSGETALIKVKDQGVGIPESERKKIFKRFYRVEDEETRQTKGTGLGLFIVKQSIEKQGGKVWVTANEPNGSVFTIELPL
jgi:two-component system phosphate regulon sensor histidine kinase PhoR